MNYELGHEIQEVSTKELQKIATRATATIYRVASWNITTISMLVLIAANTNVKGRTALDFSRGRGRRWDFWIYYIFQFWK